MADASKLQYYTGYNAYKNLQVRSGSISITNASIAAGALRQWDTLVTVSNDSKFSSAVIQVNEDNAGTPTALHYEPFPPANVVWQTLTTDPGGTGDHDIGLYLIINDNQVTFRAEAHNPHGSSMVFSPFTVAFTYAIHTTNI